MKNQKPKKKKKKAITYLKNNLKSQNILEKKQSSFSSSRANITSQTNSKTSAGGSAMVMGNTLSSNKSVLANEGAFTERGSSLNYPRNYHETYKNMQTVTDLFENGVVEEDVLDTLEWAKLSNFQESYEKITPQTDSRKLIFIKWNCP